MRLKKYFVYLLTLAMVFIFSLNALANDSNESSEKFIKTFNGFVYNTKTGEDVGRLNIQERALNKQTELNVNYKGDKYHVVLDSNGAEISNHVLSFADDNIIKDDFGFMEIVKEKDAYAGYFKKNDDTFAFYATSNGVDSEAFLENYVRKGLQGYNDVNDSEIDIQSHYGRVRGSLDNTRMRLQVLGAERMSVHNTYELQFRLQGKIGHTSTHGASYMETILKPSVDNVNRMAFRTVNGYQPTSSTTSVSLPISYQGFKVTLRYTLSGVEVNPNSQEFRWRQWSRNGNSVESMKYTGSDSDAVGHGAALILEPAVTARGTDQYGDFNAEFTVRFVSYAGIQPTYYETYSDRARWHVTFDS